MRFKKLLKPHPDFAARMKAGNLETFKEKFPEARVATRGAFIYIFRGAMGGVALMVILIGTSVYADQQNVGPSNPLYVFKRSQEAVNLFFVSDGEKPSLHLKLAERRLEELDEVTRENPKSSKVSDLTKDFREEIKNSITTFTKDDRPVSALEQKGERESRDDSEKKQNIEKENKSGKTDSVKEKPRVDLLKSKDRTMLSPAIPIQGNVSSSGIMLPQQNNKEVEHDGDTKEDRRDVTSTPVKGFSAPSVQSFKTEGEAEDITKEHNIARFCESWVHLTGNNADVMREIIDENPEFLVTLKQKCPNIGNGD